MMKYLITYDLVGTSETSADYVQLIEKIRAYPNWGKLQKSVWLISTNQSAVEVRDFLWSSMDANDRIMVLELTGTAAWENALCEHQWLLTFLNS